MQVQFNRPVTVVGVTYGKGQHAVPESVKGDWFFEALVQDGDAVILRADNHVEAEAQNVVERPVEVVPHEPDVLDGTTKEIAAAIEGMEVEELVELMEREKAGKTRKGVVKLLEDAIGGE